ncbi:MAG: hypothetical protein GY784_06865 [Gammaproteobacteria bacterium]|nr:hypothetical protein [Gammaproteobacteria bacterium]
MNQIICTIVLALLMLVSHGTTLADTQATETRICGAGETEADGCIIVSSEEEEEEEEEEPDCD